MGTDAMEANHENSNTNGLENVTANNTGPAVLRNKFIKTRKAKLRARRNDIVLRDGLAFTPYHGCCRDDV